jgi:hypothetical protein
MNAVWGHLGKPVTRVQRALYQFDATIEPDDGDLQLHFESGVLRFRCAGFGDALELHSTPWQDPFAGELSPENSEYITTHGKWVLVDLSAAADYRTLIGRPLDRATPSVDARQLVTAVQLVFGARTISVRAEHDALVVQFVGRAGSR